MIFKKVMIMCMALVLGAMPVWAQVGEQLPVGAPELKLVTLLLTGSVGLALGLLIAIYGVYTLSASQNPVFGLVLIILGVLITLTPQIYKGTRLVVCPLIKTLSSNAVCS